MRGLALQRIVHDAKPMTRSRVELQLSRLDARRMCIDEERVALGEEVPRVVNQALGVYKEERHMEYNGHKVYSLVDKDKEPLVMYFDTMPGDDNNGTLPVQGWWITFSLGGNEYVMWNEGDFETPPEKYWHSGKVPLDEYGYADPNWQGEFGLPVTLHTVDHAIGREPPRCAKWGCREWSKVWCWAGYCQTHCDASWEPGDTWECPAHPWKDRVPRNERQRTPGRGSVARRWTFDQAMLVRAPPEERPSRSPRSWDVSSGSASNIYLRTPPASKASLRR